MFQVYESGRKADCTECNVHESWDKSSFDSWDEALAYATKWLGYPEGSTPPLVLGEEWDYNGYGDTMCIKEI